MLELVLLFTVLILVLLLGPKPKELPYTPRIKPDLDLPQLENWIHQQELNELNVQNGSEKRIIWHQPHQQTEVAVIYLHGLSATQKELSPVPELVGEALAANVYLGRLAGHGQPPERLQAVTMLDWQQDVIESFEIAQKIGKKTIVIATSTGATLATWALQNPVIRNQVERLIFVSPNFGVKEKHGWLLTMPWAKFIVPLVHGRHHQWLPMNSQQAKWWSWRYPVATLYQMQLLIQRVSMLDVSPFKLPLQIYMSPTDNVIDTDKIQQFATSWPAKCQLIPVHLKRSDGSNHVLAGDIIHSENNEYFVQSIVQFVLSE